MKHLLFLIRFSINIQTIRALWACFSVQCCQISTLRSPYLLRKARSGGRELAASTFVTPCTAYSEPCATYSAISRWEWQVHLSMNSHTSWGCRYELWIFFTCWEYYTCRKSYNVRDKPKNPLFTLAIWNLELSSNEPASKLDKIFLGNSLL